MALTPRLTLDEGFIDEMKCAICESTQLKVVHVDKYPDFVSCDQCGSAFVVENQGSWVMYGKIPAEYPETSQFALKQWAWLEAVVERAKDEREEKAATEGAVEPPAPVEELPTPEETSSSPPFVEERSTPSMDDLFPEEPVTPDAQFTDDGPQKPPFPDDVIILGDDSTDSPGFEDVTPSFMEPDPSPEERIIVPPAPTVDTTETDDAQNQASINLEDRLPDALTSPELEVEVTDTEGTDDFAFQPVEIADDELPDGPSGESSLTQADEPRFPDVDPEEELQTTEQLPQEGTPKSLSVPVGEPDPDRRYRVMIEGSQPKYPKNYCAHCLKTPVKLKSIMRSSLPDPKQPGSRKLVALELPFCQDCQNRMDARSQDENFARILAFSISIIVALVAIAVPIIFNLVDLQANAFLSIIVLLVFAVLGFSLPLLLLLTRANKYPPPRDAAVVLSTLIVLESGPNHTQFEWRNRGYAELFRQVNSQNVHGDLKMIGDRTAFIEPQPDEIPEASEEVVDVMDTQSGSMPQPEQEG